MTLVNALLIVSVYHKIVTKVSVNHLAYNHTHLLTSLMDVSVQQHQSVVQVLVALPKEHQWLVNLHVMFKANHQPNIKTIVNVHLTWNVLQGLA